MKSQEMEKLRFSQSSLIHHSLFSIAALLFLANGVLYAYCALFSKFRIYDDEGFMMVSVRGYLEGHALYDSVSTVYGPFYYFWEYLFHTLTSLPVTHDVTGCLCVFHWMATATILGLAGSLMTDSRLLGFFVFMQATVHLSGMSNEPGHPQELAAVLLALSVMVARGGLLRQWRVGLLASIGAALVFTKSSIGVFYGIAFALALVCHTPFFQSRRALFWGALMMSAFLPFLLMRAHSGERWAQEYSTATCITFIAVGGIAYAFAGTPKMGFARWVEAAIGFSAASSILVVALLVTGSSVSATVNCLVTTPAKFPSIFCRPLRIPDSQWLSTVSLFFAAVTFALKTRLRSMYLGIAVCKGIYGLIGTLWLVNHPQMQMEYLLPWAWLVLVPNQKEQAADRSDTFSRTFLCLAACWQALQAYPVAGTQVVIGTLLAVLVFSLCLYDAITEFAAEPWISARLESLQFRNLILADALMLAVLLFLFAGSWCVPGPCWRGYRSLSPLDLPGASCLRVQPFQVTSYRELSEYLRQECDSFVSIPGFNSLHFWAGRPPVTYFNIAEVLLLSDRQQNQVVVALQKAKRPLILINEQGILTNEQGSTSLSTVLRQGPLAHFIQNDCREVKRFKGYRILAPVRQYPEVQSDERGPREPSSSSFRIPSRLADSSSEGFLGPKD